MSALPRLVRFLLKTAAVGASLGCALALALVLTDTAGLGTLIRDTVDPVSPLLLLMLGFATLIGSLYTGSAIMLLPTDGQDDIWRTIGAETPLKGGRLS